MYQYDDPSVVATLPTPAAAGTPGYFTDGDAAGGSPATILRSDFMNMLMMELLNVIDAAGITPSKTAYNQVLTALNDMFAKLAGSSTQVFSVANPAQSSHAVNLGQFANSLAASGYQKLPGGLILQWGTLAVSGSGTTTATGTVTFPVAFPTAFAAGSATTTNAANTSGDRVICQVNGALSTMGITLDTNGVIAINQTQNISWMAIGY